MKRIICLVTGILFLLATLLMAGCGMRGSNSGSDSSTSNGQAGGTTLKVGFGSSMDTSSGGQGLKKFKELVEQKSNGRIKVELFGDGQLGNDKSMMEALQMGTLDITLPSSSPVAELTKAFMVFDLPFLFTTPEQVDKVLDGENGRAILATLDTVNIKGLCYFENGFRNITNSKRPILKAADLQGMKIRTMQNPIMLETFKLWGANPVPMAFNEVFTALEQKIIDGQENPNTLIYDAGFYEAQKYITVSHHFYTPYVFMISKKKWDTLSAEDRKIVQECADEAKKYQREINRKIDGEYLQKMKDKGIEVNELSPAAIAEMKQIAQPVYDKFTGDIGKERLDAILKELK